MIPIRDTVESRNYPVVNTGIICINVLLFLVQISKGQAMEQFIYTYGLIPARYSVPEIGAYFSFSQQVIAFISFMFLHGGFWHLLGNMWSLYIFGDNIEDRLGHVRYLLFYILCGLASGLFHLFINWNSQVPTIGASGAIAGVMGAYLILFPRSKILTLIPIFIIPYFIEIPAFFFLCVWFLFQFLNAAGSSAQGGGIAWWAHIGGFISGILLLQVFIKVPDLGITGTLQNATSKKKSSRLQVIRTVGIGNEPHLYGDIKISAREARLGTIKLVNIPWGFQSRLFRVRIPSGVSKGTTLRMKGMGRKMINGKAGDLYLKILINNQGYTIH
jgi:membrane associated rhomboid family serine protease